MKKPKAVETTFATYQVGKLLGQGGSGVVYEVTSDSGDNFAAKFLDPARASTEKRKRFKNEYLFCSRTDHPNILKVSDHGISSDGAPFFVMPLFERSLRYFIGQISPDQALGIFEQVLNGVEAAHLLGVSHRDLKPENVLLRDDGKSVVVADFGIARFEEDDLLTAVETKNDARLANFLYAAPEQKVRGGEVGPAADLYALGLMLNELITGQVPLGTKFLQIRDVAEALAYIDPIVDRLLAQDASARFASSTDLKRELKARGRQAIATQRVSEVEGRVIPATEADSALVDDPIRIVDADWDNNQLTIELNHVAPAEWRWALVNMGSYRSIMGKGPEIYQVQGTKVRVQARADEAQRLVDQFKEWLPKVQQVYLEKLENDRRQEEHRKQQEYEAVLAKEQERENVLKSLKF